MAKSELQGRSVEHGRRKALTAMLRAVLEQLGYKDPAAAQAAWILERQRAVVALRDACGTHGDNDWDDDLDLADVIGKHLVNHLG